MDGARSRFAGIPDVLKLLLPSGKQAILSLTELLFHGISLNMEGARLNR